MNKWVARHRWLAMLVFNVLAWIPVVLILDMLNMALSLWWAIYGVFMLLLSYVWADSSRFALLTKALATFENMCDPYPLEETVREQLSYVKLKSQRIGLFINLSATLEATGRHEESVENLERVDVDTCTSVTPLMKFVYYHNLASAYLRTGKMEPVPFLLQKEHQILLNLKTSQKSRNKLTESYNLNLADFHVCNREYDIAYSFIKKSNYENASLHQKVTINLLKAQILVGTGKPEEARPHLDFVLRNGNKLYDVEIARRYLER